MCRSIKTLREPYTENVTEQDVRAAALQYVRKVSGFRRPARHNADAFDRAVDAVAGRRKPLTFLTYCSAAARTSCSVTFSV